MADLSSNPAALSQVLSMLSANDTATIRQGEKILKQYMKNPNSLFALLNQIRGSPEPTIRHHAALLIKKKMEKHFPKLDAANQVALQTEVLNIMKAEPIKVVSIAIAGSVSTLAGVIFSSGAQWPELFGLLMELSQSPTENLRVVRSFKFHVSVLISINVIVNFQNLSVKLQLTRTGNGHTFVCVSNV